MIAIPERISHTNGLSHQEVVFIPAVVPVSTEPPDISVLIPAYNASETICRAVASAMQARVTVEVIVCDDASTDDTRELLATLFQYDCIRVVQHETNRGQAAALNSAAAAATGRYLMELDADDWLDANSLAALVYALDTSPDSVGLAYGATRFHGPKAGLYVPPPYQRGQFHHAFVSMYAFLYRREAWDAGCRYGMSYDAPDGKRPAVQDWDMALQLTEHMRYDAAVLPECTVLNHQWGNTEGNYYAIQDSRTILLAQMQDKWPMFKAEAL